MKGGDALSVAATHFSYHSQSTSGSSSSNKCRRSTPEKWQTRFRPKGLTNVGNTCYANAVLQCLLSTALTQALMDPTAISVFRQYSFNNILLRQGSGSVDSRDKKKQRKKKDREMNQSQSQSNSELQDKCVWLTRELKKVTAQYVSITSQHDMNPPTLTDSFSSLFVTPPAPEINPQNITRYPHRLSSCLRPYQQEDAHEFLRALLETLAMNGRNKELSSLFDGLMESSITCQNCGTPSLTRDRYMDLSLDIADDHIETLSDALKQFTQSENLSGDNKVFCAVCEKKCFVTKTLRLATAPSILVCHMKRFAFNQYGGLTRLNKKVKFPTRLEITDFMSNLNQSRPPSYELVAVLVHQGQSCEAGHYVAFVKSEGEWFCCNDREVNRVPVEKVMRQQAYILMYEVAEMRENHGFPSPSGSPRSQEAPKPRHSRSEPSMLSNLLCALEDTAIHNICCVSHGVHLTPSRRARDDGEVGRQRAHDAPEYEYQSTSLADEFRKSSSAAYLNDLGKRQSGSKPSRTRRLSDTESDLRPCRFTGSGSDLRPRHSDRDLRPPRPKSALHRRSPSLDRQMRPPRHSRPKSALHRRAPSLDPQMRPPRHSSSSRLHTSML